MHVRVYVPLFMCVRVSRDMGIAVVCVCECVSVGGGGGGGLEVGEGLCACMHVCLCIRSLMCAHVHVSAVVLMHLHACTCICAHTCVHRYPMTFTSGELAPTGGIMIIQRNNKNVGKHLFGIGNISASCSNVFLSTKVYKFMTALKNRSKILLY